MRPHLCLIVLVGLASAAHAAPDAAPAGAVLMDKTRCAGADHKYVVVGRVVLKLPKTSHPSSNCQPAAGDGKTAPPAQAAHP